MAKRIYFIGIGGISMSSLAAIAAAKGNKICGSDIMEGESLKTLDNFNIPYFIGHKEENIKSFKPNLVVVSGAISEDNPELVWARQNKKKILTRAEFLGNVSKEFKNVIAISGTHGKTTTSALISEIFIEANLKPTVHIGGVLKRNGSSFLIGNKKYFITEACEYKNSFLTLNPTVGVVLNIEPDHLDFFKNLTAIKHSFNCFLNNSKTKIFKNGDYDYILKNEKTSAIYSAKNIKKTSIGYKFDFYENGLMKASIQTNFSGQHNVKNALVACAVATYFKIKIPTIKKAIRHFSGVKRRFEKITRLENTIVIHDYAHHPTEISKVISQAKMFGKVLTVFQPHTFSRTKKLFKEFLTAFNETDGLMLFKTYPAREEEDKSASAKALYEKLLLKNPNFGQRQLSYFDQNKFKQEYVQYNQTYNETKFGQISQKYISYFETFEDAKNEIIKLYKNYDCILILGAGDIYELAYILKRSKADHQLS